MLTPEQIHVLKTTEWRINDYDEDNRGGIFVDWQYAVDELDDAR